MHQRSPAPPQSGEVVAQVHQLAGDFFNLVASAFAELARRWLICDAVRPEP